MTRPPELTGSMTDWERLTPEEQGLLIEVVERAKKEQAAQRVVVMEVTCFFDRPVRSWTVLRVEP